MATTTTTNTHPHRVRAAGRSAGPRPAVRDVPLQHDHAEHRRDHRLGTDHRVLHPGRVDTQREDRHDGRAQHLLPAADPDRLHRRQARVRRPRRRRRRVLGHRRHHGHQRPDLHRDRRAGPDVPGRHDHGAAHGPRDEEARRALEPQDQAGLRDARQQLLGRHPRRVDGDRRHVPARAGPASGHRVARRRGEHPRRQRAAPADLDLHRAGEGALPQQRHQPRRADPARHPGGRRPGTVGPLPARGQPRSRSGSADGLHLLRARPGQGLGPGRGDHPVLRRHPRGLLPLRADEAQDDPGDHRRRHDRHLPAGPVRRRPAGSGRSGLDLRRVRADARAATSSASPWASSAPPWSRSWWARSC